MTNALGAAMLGAAVIGGALYLSPLVRRELMWRKVRRELDRLRRLV